jgi:hypothetical protein
MVSGFENRIDARRAGQRFGRSAFPKMQKCRLNGSDAAFRRHLQGVAEITADYWDF